jgi:hypothetical protein
MGTNRKLPFGYKMEYGRVVINPTEAHWVLHLYKRYGLGETIRELTELMNNTGVQYDIGKSWNKNMVARILADSRYIGERGYPPIVEVEVFHGIAEKKQKKAPAVQKTEARKMLRRKCDRRITSNIEHEVLYLLNRLAADPEQIKTPDAPPAQSERLKILKTELEDLLDRLPVDEERTREKLQEIAVAMYETVDPREYETHRMKRLFQKEQPRAELDAKLIAQTISAVMVDSNGRVKIKLKNDKIIERG